MGSSGLSIDSLDGNEGTGSLGLTLNSIVLVDTIDEGSARSGHADVLNTDMESLGNDTATNLLVYDNTDRVLGNIIDDTGLSVVELVGHTLLDGTVSDNINVISLLVTEHNLVQGGNTVLSERLGE